LVFGQAPFATRFGGVPLAPPQQSCARSGAWFWFWFRHRLCFSSEEFIGATGLEHPVCLLPLLFRQIIALARFAVGDRLQDRNGNLRIIQHVLGQGPVVRITRNPKVVVAGPLLTSLPNLHADIVAPQQIKVGRRPVHWRRKPRDLVFTMTDDAITKLTETGRTLARILGTRIVVPKRGHFAAGHVVTTSCRRWIS